jgi:hypothetical protein
MSTTKQRKRRIKNNLFPASTDLITAAQPTFENYRPTV